MPVLRFDRARAMTSGAAPQAAVPESQDELPPLDEHTQHCIDSLKSTLVYEERAALTELRCRRKQLIATRAELRNLKLAASLACELHGCASAGCTMAQYHEDVQKLFADLAAKDAQIANLTKGA